MTTVPVHGGDVRGAALRWGHSPTRLLDFSANLNPFGPPEPVAAALAEAGGSIRHYPEPYARTLRTRLAAWLGICDRALAVTAGASEALERLACLLALESGHNLSCVLPSPSFAGYARAARAAGARVRLMEGPVLTPSALAAQLTRADGATTTVIYLGNPNNPTSTVLSRAEILELATTAAAHRAWLVVDEAFVHFLEPPGAADAHWSVATLAPGLPNLLVVGSLTKLFAFPGLRVGYVVGAPAIIEELDARRDPWTVGALAQAAAVAALGSWDYLGETRRWLSATRSGFASALAALPGVRVGHEPQANFVLFEVTSAGLDAAAVVEALGRRGILLRDASNFPGLGRGYLRSAIRTRPQNYRLLRALGAVCGGR